MHIVPNLNTGGMENGVVNLCNGHNRRYFKPYICCLNSQGTLKKRLKSDINVDVIGINEGKKILSPLLMAKYLNKIRPHIVHTHGFSGGSYTGIIGAKLAGVPVIINGEHGRFSIKNYQIIIQKILSKFCSVNLSVSKSLKFEIVRNIGIPTKKIKVIPNGVDINKFNGAHKIETLKKELNQKYRINFSEKNFIIGCIGSLKTNKNQILLLEALTILNNIDISKKIVLMIGTGPTELLLKRKINELNINNSVFFLGERDDIPNLLSLIDVLVSTSISKHEGMSNVVLEALSSRVPVITTKSVGSTEIVKNNFNGYIIPSGDATELADKISSLFNDQYLMNQFKNNAREFIKNKFTLEKMIENYEKTYFKYLK